MEDIKGEKYELAGFQFQHAGSLVSVFAKFSKIGKQAVEDCARYPSHYGEAVKPYEFDPEAPILIDPCLSAGQIFKALVGEDDLAAKNGAELDVTGAEDVINDLGAEKLGQLLVEMGKVRKKYLKGQTTIFISKSDLAL